MVFAIFPLSHSEVLGINRSETINSRVSCVAGPIGRSCVVVDSHKSRQILIVEPFPTCQLSCVLRRSLSTNRLRHPCDEEALGLQCRNDSLGQYFPNKIHANSPIGFSTSLQLNLDISKTKALHRESFKYL